MSVSLLSHLIRLFLPSISNDSGSLSIVELDYDELYEEEEAKQQDTVVSISYKDVVFSISFSEPHALIAKTIM